jgi:hypothetical protein
VRPGPLRLPQSWVAAALAQWARAARRAGDEAAAAAVLRAVGGDPAAVAPGLAAEFAALVAAADWPAAAAFLGTEYGPVLFAEKGSAGRAALRAALAVLVPHAAAVDVAAGAGTWRAGPGLFAAFFAAEAAVAGGGGGGGGEGADPEAALAALSDALTAAAADEPGGGDASAARTRRAALGDIASAAAGWLLSAAAAASGGAPEDVAASGAVDLPGLPPDVRVGHVSAAAAALAEAAA